MKSTLLQRWLLNWLELIIRIILYKQWHRSITFSTKLHPPKRWKLPICPSSFDSRVAHRRTSGTPGPFPFQDAGALAMVVLWWSGTTSGREFDTKDCEVIGVMLPIFPANIGHTCYHWFFMTSCACQKPVKKTGQKRMKSVQLGDLSGGLVVTGTMEFWMTVHIMSTPDETKPWFIN